MKENGKGGCQNLFCERAQTGEGQCALLVVIKDLRSIRENPEAFELAARRCELSSNNEHKEEEMARP